MSLRHELQLVPASKITVRRTRPGRAEQRHIHNGSRRSCGLARPLGERPSLTLRNRGYFLKGIHFCLLLELATTVSMKSMPRTPESTFGKSRASSLGFSPAMLHFTASQKFM